MCIGWHNMHAAIRYLDCWRTVTIVPVHNTLSHSVTFRLPATGQANPLQYQMLTNHAALLPLLLTLLQAAVPLLKGLCLVQARAAGAGASGAWRINCW